MRSRQTIGRYEVFGDERGRGEIWNEEILRKE